MSIRILWIRIFLEFCCTQSATKEGASIKSEPQTKALREMLERCEADPVMKARMDRAKELQAMGFVW